MDLSFEKPSLKKQRIPEKSRALIPITIVIAIILMVSALLDYWGSRRELSHVLRDQSQALITALEKGSQNAIASYDLVQELVAQRLLNNARLLEEMDFAGTLDEAFLRKLAERNDIFRINVFDDQGRKIMASFHGYGWGAGRDAPDDLMQFLENKDRDEWVIGFKSSRFGDNQRFAVAKKRRKGGLILLNVDSQDMLNFRKSIGLGKLVRDIAETKGVAYIALSDSSRIIVASAGVDSLSFLDDDKYILQKDKPYSHFIEYRGEKIFEIVHLFNPENREVLRIGLHISHLQDAQNTALTRVILSSILLFIFGAIGASLVVSSQNVRILKDAYFRIESYTGSMLENMTDAIVAVNSKGDITLVNNAAENLFNISGKNVLGKACALEIVTICPYLKSGLDSGQGTLYIEEELESAHGRLVVDMSVHVILDTNKQPDIVFAVIRDRTALKLLEANLKRKDQITAMGHLASGVAHEIRNPLNAIGMISQRLKNEFHPQDDEQEYLQLTSTVVSETRRINTIIQQFLEFAKPAELVRSHIKISDLFNQVSALLQSQAERKNIDYSTTCTNDTTIVADADKLKQVLLNLGQNAIDACASKDKIDLSCDTKDNSIVILISDTGQGMTTEEQRKIFNLYFTTKEHGTGIGLSVVQQIVSQHNGFIHVKSTKNVGSTFSITLPRE